MLRFGAVIAARVRTGLVFLLLAGCGSDDSGDAVGTTAMTAGSGTFTLTCERPTAVLQPGGNPSGFETCDDGFVHRVSAPICVVTPPDNAQCVPLFGGDSGCSTDADCTERPFGACIDTEAIDGSSPSGCQCEYGCETDADCPDGRVCACGRGPSSRSQCIVASCSTDADCGGGLCGLGAPYNPCGTSPVSLSCLTADSECRRSSCVVDEQCAENLVPACVLSNDAWICDYSACSIGSCG